MWLLIYPLNSIIILLIPADKRLQTRQRIQHIEDWHFPESICLNGHICIVIRMPLKFIPQGKIDSKS